MHRAVALTKVLAGGQLLKQHVSSLMYASIYCELIAEPGSCANAWHTAALYYSAVYTALQVLLLNSRAAADCAEYRVL